MEQKNINNNLLQIWFNSYKRYKYWLGIYYLIFLVFFVILTNIKDWSIIFEFKDIRNKVSLIEYMEEKIDTSLFEKDINILHIPAKFARYKTPYDFNKNQEGKYFKERRKIITAFSNIIPDIDTNKYFLSDSLVILEVMEKYRSYKDSMKIIKPQKKDSPIYVSNLKKKLPTLY